MPTIIVVRKSEEKIRADIAKIARNLAARMADPTCPGLLSAECREGRMWMPEVDCVACQRRKLMSGCGLL